MQFTRHDAHELYSHAMDSALRFVSAVRPDQWHNATPDDEWDMTELVNHITSENLWLAEMFGGKTMEEIGDSLSGDLVGDDPAGAFRQSVERARRPLPAIPSTRPTYSPTLRRPAVS
jgi:hypothetical protein